MEFDELISAIHCRPQLWSKDEIYSCNRAIAEKLWEDIAVELDTTKDECRKKWKYLKDEYRKALRKQQTATGSASKIRFKYFEKLNFIKESFGGFDETDNPATPSPNKPMNMEVSKKERESGAEPELPDNKEKAVRPRLSTLGLDRPEVSDMEFLKSLWPFFKDLDPIKTLTLRIEIENLIIQTLSSDD